MCVSERSAWTGTAAAANAETGCVTPVADGNPELEKQRGEEKSDTREGPAGALCRMSCGRNWRRGSLSSALECCLLDRCFGAAGRGGGPLVSFHPEVKHDHEVAALRSAWRVGSA